MNTRTLAPALAATALVATAVVVAGPGAPTSAEEDGTTLTFTLSEDGFASKYLDHGRKGPSIGDHHLTSLSLEQDGAVAGRVEVDCLATDRVYQGQTCEFGAQLADGTLFFEGIGFHEEIPHVGAGDDTVHAITGGTGAYAGAEGEVTIGLADTGPVTITLLP